MNEHQPERASYPCQDFTSAKRRPTGRTSEELVASAREFMAERPRTYGPATDTRTDEQFDADLDDFMDSMPNTYGPPTD